MKAHFIHGWGFGPAIWRQLVLHLPNVEPSFADRGYFGGSGAEPPQERSVFITHSLGAMLTIGALPPQCICLVTVNGFDRFVAGEDSPGVAKRVLDRMLSRLELDASAVVTEFRRKCGVRDAIGGIQPSALQRDLLALRDWDCRAKAAMLPIPVLSLQGAHDPILPAEMREGTLRGVPNIQHRLHPSAGHLLPVQDPAWCAAQIAIFLKELG